MKLNQSWLIENLKTKELYNKALMLNVDLWGQVIQIEPKCIYYLSLAMYFATFDVKLTWEWAQMQDPF